jgi:hypothetical protein
MDATYFIGPAFVSALFAYLAVNTDGLKHPAIRLMYMGSCLAALLVLMNVAQIAAIYGEIVLDSTTFNATSNVTTYAYTHVSPVAAANYDMIWLVASVAIWLVFVQVILSLFAMAVEMLWRAFFNKPAGFDEVG